MNDVTNQEVNLTDQSNTASIEAALQQAQQAIASIPLSTNPHVLSTDPIPPVHHINLIDNKDKLTEVSADMKNYHVEDKFASIKKVVVAEEKKFLGLSTAHKIEIVIVGLVAISIVIAAFKFL